MTPLEWLGVLAVTPGVGVAAAVVGSVVAIALAAWFIR